MMIDRIPAGVVLVHGPVIQINTAGAICGMIVYIIVIKEIRP